VRVAFYGNEKKGFTCSSVSSRSMAEGRPGASLVALFLGQCFLLDHLLLMSVAGLDEKSIANE